jgi:hypothetical protein
LKTSSHNSKLVSASLLMILTLSLTTASSGRGTTSSRILVCSLACHEWRQCPIIEHTPMDNFQTHFNFADVNQHADKTSQGAGYHTNLAQEIAAATTAATAAAIVHAIFLLPCAAAARGHAANAALPVPNNGGQQPTGAAGSLSYCCIHVLAHNSAHPGHGHQRDATLQYMMLGGNNCIWVNHPNRGPAAANG